MEKQETFLNILRNNSKQTKKRKMSLSLVALFTGVASFLSYFAIRRFFPELARKQASKQLEEVLFPKGNRQKDEVLKAFREITEGRFSEEEMLDYFFKIKGLQTIEINSKTNFWLKKYLFSPTTIKLNYFEQVNFYKTFLNLPIARMESPAKPMDSPSRPSDKQPTQKNHIVRLSKTAQ
ncbi:hypothetical protein ACT29H_08190 [Thermophagus sp. OGC60D27]|uniref:hypothetical protein n=1 Tax=Thermophagus sp. OGC60D27 TaxID=3458415 RepID=UPI0040379D33